MHATPEQLALYAALAVAGIAGGFVNTVAGGGSLLTVPVLILLGLPASVANGTNRLAVVAQTLAGSHAFHRQGMLDAKTVVPVTIPTILGAIAGAYAAASVPDAVLEPVLLGTLIAMALLMLARPKIVGAREGEEPRSPWRHAPSFAGLVVAGAYGGFVQGGVGFVLLAVLGGLLRYDTLRANAIKLVCVLFFSVPALAIFAAHGDVAWIPAAILACGTVIGALLGVRFAIKMAPAILRWIIVGTVIVSCVAALLKG
jgi:uncharacterized membrane protein YfcA